MLMTQFVHETEELLHLPHTLSPAQAPPTESAPTPEHTAPAPVPTKGEGQIVPPLDEYICAECGETCGGEIRHHGIDGVPICCGCWLPATGQPCEVCG